MIKVTQYTGVELNKTDTDRERIEFIRRIEMTPKQAAQLEIAVELLDGLIDGARDWTAGEVDGLVRKLELLHTQAHDRLVDVAAKELE